MGRLNFMATATLLVVVLAAAAVTTASASKADVNIFNEVGEQIWLHCHSGKTDMGLQQLLPGGKYGWGFTPNYIKSTLYWCHFAWGNHPQPVFDVWKDEGVLGQATRFCTLCEYHVRPDGFYRNEVGKSLVRVHTWS